MANKTVKNSAKPAARKSVKTPAAESNVVLVPRPARGSYNPNRPLSKNTLLLNQVRHFQQVENTLPKGQQTGHDPESIATEGQAAEYLRKMTALLHRQARKAAPVLKAGGK